jgi:hypothetical protein
MSCQRLIVLQCLINISYWSIGLHPSMFVMPQDLWVSFSSIVLFIPFIEVCLKPLSKIMKHEYTSRVGNLWDSTATPAFKELWQCILHDPCHHCFDHKKLTIL